MGITVLCFGVVITALICLLVMQCRGVHCLIIHILLHVIKMLKMACFRPEADVLELRRRYSNMYIPSDFFSTNFRWVDAFPPHNPFTLDQPCSFHVMNKEVDAVVENVAVLEPPDADYLFSAKVRVTYKIGQQNL